MKYKEKSVKIDDIDPSERDYIISEITSNMSKAEKEKGTATRRLYSKKDNKDYMYNLTYNKDGMHKIKRYEIDESKYD